MAKSIARKMAEKLKMPEKPKGTPGRPSVRYDATKAMKFLQLLSTGTMSMRAICEMKDMPSRDAIFRWVRENPDFAAAYHQARSDQMHGYVDDTVFIADTEEDTQRARVKIDARRWVAERLEPKHYGPRIEHEHTAQVTTTNINVLENLTDQEREQLRAMISKAQQREENVRQQTLIEGVVR